MPETNKQIHTHLRSISRVNTLLAIGSLIAVGFLYVWFKFSLLPASQAAQDAVERQNTVTEQSQQKAEDARQVVDVVDQEALGETYRSTVNDMLSGYAFDDSGVASDHLSTLLDMRVPAAMQNAHLEIVIALTEAQQGDYTAAQERITAVSASYAWLETGVQ